MLCVQRLPSFLPNARRCQRLASALPQASSLLAYLSCSIREVARICRQPLFNLSSFAVFGVRARVTFLLANDFLERDGVPIPRRPLACVRSKDTSPSRVLHMAGL